MLRRLLVLGALVAASFLALCFYWPTPAARYTFFPDRPDWYRLDTLGIEGRP